MDRIPGRGLVPRETPASDIHPLVYLAIAGLVLWFVVSAFAFADGGYVEYLLTIVGGFFLIVAAIPFLLWQVWLRHGDGGAAKAQPLREWSAGECDTWQCRINSREAAVQTLLPIAGVAFGMTALAVVLLLVEHHLV